MGAHGMKQFLAALALGCLLAAGGAARCADPAPAADKSAAYLGVLFGPLSEVFYSRFPELPHDRGVVVTQVLAGSPAEKAGLCRDDILLQYNNKKIADCDDLVRLLQEDRPGKPVRITLLRDGKETTTDALLIAGPAIKTAQEAKGGPGEGRASPSPAGRRRSASPPRRFEHGRLKVTIEFYPEGRAGSKPSAARRPGGAGRADRQAEFAGARAEHDPRRSPAHLRSQRRQGRR